MKMLIDIPDKVGTSNLVNEIDCLLTDYFNGTYCDISLLDEMTNGEILKEIFSKGYPELRSVSAPNTIYLDDIETCRGGFKEEWWEAKYENS